MVHAYVTTAALFRGKAKFERLASWPGGYIFGGKQREL
jgi:hypothetical protein